MLFKRFIKPFASVLNFKAEKEWLETNGLGAVISGTVGLCNQRNYHAHYSIVNNNGERITLVNDLHSFIKYKGKTTFLSSHFYSPTHRDPRADLILSSFEDFPWPKWTFRIDKNTYVTKEILFVKKTNRVLIRFATNSATPIDLNVRPQVSGRSYFGIRKDYEKINPDALNEKKGSLAISLDNHLPDFKISHNGDWHKEEYIFWNNYYPMTADRMEDPWENLWSPGELEFKIDQTRDAAIDFHLSDEEEGDFQSFINEEREKRIVKLNRIHSKNQELLKIAYHADDFLFTRSDGKESILAGFPWFLDWGRDSFISLEGLLLVSGKTDQAFGILKHFAAYEKNGLLPNMFPNLGNEPIYNSVDAPLLFIKAAFTTLLYGADKKEFIKDLWPSVIRIINSFIKGTSYNIKADDSDGLIYAGATGSQLTWMDAKVNGVVITARIGKPIEINALWFLALKNAINFARENDLEVDCLWEKYFLLIKENFILKFYDEKENFLRDVYQAKDPLDEKKLRPNALFALAYACDLFQRPLALKLLSRIEKELLTPFGIRTLSIKDPDFVPRYKGDIIERDHAYHQGTAWPFLLGVYADAQLVWNPGQKHQKISCLWKSLLSSSQKFSCGHIAEIFDATNPQNPQGCYAQAWSDAELIRIAYKMDLISFD